MSNEWLESFGYVVNKSYEKCKKPHTQLKDNDGFFPDTCVLVGFRIKKEAILSLNASVIIIFYNLCQFFVWGKSK